MDSSDLTSAVWKVDPASFPSDGSIEEQLRFLLRYAVLAPSSHNSQPWSFAIDGDTVEISAVEDRWLDVADRDRRELHLSIGCALENLCIAAERFGFDYQTQYQTSRSPDSSVRVTFDPDREVTTSRPEGLFEQLTERVTNRKLYTDEPLEVSVVDLLQDSLVSNDVHLHLIENPEIPGSFEGFQRGIDEKINVVEGPDAWEFTRDLQKMADRRLLADEDYRGELAEWVGNGALGSWWPKRVIEQYVIARYDFGEREGEANVERIESAPILAVLSSAEDNATQQVRTGQVYERMALGAAREGAAVHPLSQTLERPDTRRRLGNLAELTDHTAQHLFRIGYAESTPSHTPRLPVDVVLEDAD